MFGKKFFHDVWTFLLRMSQDLRDQAECQVFKVCLSLILFYGGEVLLGESGLAEKVLFEFAQGFKQLNVVAHGLFFLR